MSLFVVWQSDGFVACVAPVLYGRLLHAQVLPRVRRRETVTRLLPLPFSGTSSWCHL